MLVVQTGKCLDEAAMSALCALALDAVCVTPLCSPKVAPFVARRPFRPNAQTGIIMANDGGDGVGTSTDGMWTGSA